MRLFIARAPKRNAAIDKGNICSIGRQAVIFWINFYIVKFAHGKWHGHVRAVTVAAVAGGAAMAPVVCEAARCAGGRCRIRPRLRAARRRRGRAAGAGAERDRVDGA